MLLRHKGQPESIPGATEGLGEVQGAWNCAWKRKVIRDETGKQEGCRKAGLKELCSSFTGGTMGNLGVKGGRGL